MPTTARPPGARARSSSRGSSRPASSNAMMPPFWVP
jgi:hypothetical protein